MALIAGLTCSALVIAVSSTSLALTSRLAMSVASKRRRVCDIRRTSWRAGLQPQKLAKIDDCYSDCARGLTINRNVRFMFCKRTGGDYRSLSAIAREITGTAWSGPLFFGLRSNRGFLAHSRERQIQWRRETDSNDWSRHGKTPFGRAYGFRARLHQLGEALVQKRTKSSNPASLRQSQ